MNIVALAMCQSNATPKPWLSLRVQVSMYQTRYPTPKVINLRDIDTDLQTQFVRGAASVFDFRAIVDGARVEGVLRYSRHWSF